MNHKIDRIILKPFRHILLPIKILSKQILRSLDEIYCIIKSSIRTSTQIRLMHVQCTQKNSESISTDNLEIFRLILPTGQSPLN